MSELKINTKFVLEQYLNNDKVLTDFPDILEQFEESDLSEDVLNRITENYILSFENFQEIAKTNLSKIQQFENVHFVKFRIKSLYSLVTKIIQHSRPSKEGNITELNYNKKITDIIGFRILYLFKSDYLPVHKQIMKIYGNLLTENVKLKIQAGDDVSFFSGIKDLKIETNKAYRSIHYTARSIPNDDNCPRMEIQTRTIYEEAWSEMNHRLVYKKHYTEPIQRKLQDLSSYLSSLTGVCDMLGQFMLLAAEEKDETSFEKNPLEPKLESKQTDEIAKTWKKFLDVI